MAKTHYRTCNLCEVMCGLEIKYYESEVVSIKGDKDDPFSKGYICPKAVALQDIYNDPDRLKRPVKKTANGWKEISWKQAFDEVAVKLRAPLKTLCGLSESGKRPIKADVLRHSTSYGEGYQTMSGRFPDSPSGRRF